jgi:hypothetical protein
MPPKYIFIVPYRNREPHKEFFLRYMKYILEDYDDTEYEVVLSHQTDKRPFNRGAVKNIGFLHCKEKYPDDYLNINFVFHDIDVMPCKKNMFNYETTKGSIKHFYGFDYALGGIIVVKGSDFEEMNGFPNYWSWSLEDNCLQKRASKNKISIDRNVFYKIGDNRILHIHDGLFKDFSETNKHLYKGDTGNDGLKSINDLKINKIVNDVTDNYVKYEWANILTFETMHSYKDQEPPKMQNGNRLVIENKVAKTLKKSFSSMMMGRR